MRLLIMAKHCFGAALFVLFTSANAADHFTPQYLVFASDPQYPWTEATDLGLPESDSEQEKQSKVLIDAQYSDIATFRASNGGAAKVPVMINGDMTAFGHGWQRSYIKPVLDKHLQKEYDYGLGNHDYQNNVDDCFLNSCAAGSVVDFMAHYATRPTSMDLNVNKEGTIVNNVRGSLAYSTNFGLVHLVQLNNEPTYSTEFTAWNWGVPTRYTITDALDWLERDLKQARQQGRIIMLNMHKPDDWKGSDEQIDRFRTLIQDYKVTAVFAGHFHRDGGEWWDYNKWKYFGDVPVFLSGGASAQTYVTTRFSEDWKSLTVNLVKNNKWSEQQEIETVPVR
ncbi:metallophosphoesterase family protein [Pseudomonas sp. RT6P73]